MNTFMKTGAAVGALSMLAACAGNYNVEQVSAMADQGGAFPSALHKRYVERAQFEVGEGDWASVGFFNSRAEMAAMGEMPMLQMPKDRSLKVDVAAIGQAHDTLSAALNSNAPQAAPDACARAQTWLEHWMEQSAEGHQADHIAMARGEFEKAMPECKGDMPMSKAESISFIVYFDHNSAQLTPSANLIIDAASQIGMKAYASRAVLVGHTDRSGNNAYNMALSGKRAQAVAKAMLAAGMPAAEVRSSHAGEDRPQVMTADGIREGKNRRVEIMFER